MVRPDKDTCHVNPPDPTRREWRRLNAAPDRPGRAEIQRVINRQGP